MPPRGTRGARGGRSSRGGRGGAAAAAAATAASASSAPANDGPSQSDVQPTSAPTGDGSTPEVISVGSTPSVQENPTPRPSVTPSAASRGGAGAGSTRFKPKNVRRDAAERQRLEQERNRDLASKIKQEEREQRAEERRARRGGRGRGDAMSQRGFIRRTVTASGPFSGVPSENVKASKRGQGSRLGEIPHIESTRYRPRREHETRVNIDILSGFAEDVEDPETHYQTFRSGQKSGSLPMGLFRTEHQEEEVKVATAAELEAEEQQSEDDGDLFVDPLPARDPQAIDVDMDAVDDNEVWHAAPASAVKVKKEPGAEGEAMDVDLSEIPEAGSAGVKAPSSPEQQKKRPLLEGESGVVAKEKEKRRERALQDPEVQHNVLDVQALLQELRLYNEGVEQSGQNKDGRLYLFQLPPILPPLSKLSDENENENNESSPIDVDHPTVKKEEGATTTETFSALPPDGGRIGKLNVRRSGRVELDWGGTTLHLGMGTETEFLTSAVMLETKEHPENPEALTGCGYGMGQIMGNFVLTPVWDDEGDWDPSLEDIQEDVYCNNDNDNNNSSNKGDNTA